MAKYLYNGVLLPEIPSDVLAEYPYAWIHTNHTELYVAKAPWYYTSKINYLSFGSITAENRVYKVSESGEEWTMTHTFTDNGGYTQYLFWSNHDIYHIDSTEIYFYGTQPVDPNAPVEPEEPTPDIPEVNTTPKVICEKQDLINIADAIRTKTCKSDSLSLEQMATEIEGIEAGGIPENARLYYIGHANSEFSISLDVESSAVGELQEE